MDGSKQMLDAVREAKAKAKKAKTAFENSMELVKVKTSSEIDLFGGHAPSRVVDIASTVRSASDKLYTALQTQVQLLDAQCRPLLNSDPSTHAVKEVTALIQWMNEESEIGTTFKGSLNGVSFGELVSVQYIPSINNKMIQTFWENKYSDMPGTEKEDRAYQQRQSKEREAEADTRRNAKQALIRAERERREQEKKAEQQKQQERLARIAENAAEIQARRQYLRRAQGMFGGSDYGFAWVRSDGSVAVNAHFPHSPSASPEDVSQFLWIKSVVCTNDGIVGLRVSGTCIATNVGSDCQSHLSDVNKWKGIVALAAGAHHVVGLRGDGTCVATSFQPKSVYNYGQCDVNGWKDIQAIACGGDFTVGLKNDGSIVYTGSDVAQSAEKWTDMELIAAGELYVVGVTKTGEIKSTNSNIAQAMRSAENVVQLAVSDMHAYALQADGTVLGGEPLSYCGDMTLIAAKNVLAMARGKGLLLLKEDGTLEVKRTYSNTERLTESRVFESYEKYLEEAAAMEEARRLRVQEVEGYRKAGLCLYCGGTFKKTLFSCKCSKCGKAKNY